MLMVKTLVRSIKSSNVPAVVYDCGVELNIILACLQSKHETEVAEALREKEQEMKDSIKSIQTEQNKKEEEMKSKLEERDKQLNAAKVP